MGGGIVASDLEQLGEVLSPALRPDQLGAPIAVTNERAILSLGTIDAALSKPGTEVTIVWGEDRRSPKAQVEDHVPFKIRATVMPAPLVEQARTAYRSDAGLK